jgi:hypothetical protein
MNGHTLQMWAHSVPRGLMKPYVIGTLNDSE